MSNFSISLFKIDDFKSNLKLPNVGIFIFLFFVIIFSVANIYGTFALLGQKYYGFTNRENGYLFGIIGIVSTIIQGGMIKRLSVMLSEKAIILIGLIALMFGLGLLPYGSDFTGVALISVVLAIGTGILQPTLISLVSKYSPEDRQGAILGFNQSIAALARVLGPLWGGFAFQALGYEAPFVTGGIFAFITIIMTIYLFKSKKLDIN